MRLPRLRVAPHRASGPDVERTDVLPVRCAVGEAGGAAHPVAAALPLLVRIRIGVARFEGHQVEELVPG